MMVRKLTWDDFENWNALRTMALDEDPVSFGSSNEDETPKREALYKRNLEEPDHFIVGLFDDEEIIGIAGFYRHNYLKVNHKGTVWSVFVPPEHQGKGLGRKLMEGLLKNAFVINGLEQILIGATANNAAALGLYKNLGFKEYGREPRCLKFEGEFYDEVLMVLNRADYAKG
jgi:RimJ/RimL family protein N-acetyltransferase